jgi:hypothetical protein
MEWRLAAKGMQAGRMLDVLFARMSMAASSRIWALRLHRKREP